MNGRDLRLAANRLRQDLTRVAQASAQAKVFNEKELTNLQDKIEAGNEVKKTIQSPGWKYIEAIIFDQMNFATLLDATDPAVIQGASASVKVGSGILRSIEDVVAIGDKAFKQLKSQTDKES